MIALKVHVYLPVFSGGKAIQFVGDGQGVLRRNGGVSLVPAILWTPRKVSATTPADAKSGVKVFTTVNL